VRPYGLDAEASAALRTDFTAARFVGSVSLFADSIDFL
jgi:hypothetical protein